MTKIEITDQDVLLIIDPQNDFMPGGALAVPDGDAIIPIINALVKKFKNIIVSQDWHPADHQSFASQHGVEPFSIVQLSYGDQVAWPDHCVQGTRGADFAPGLDLSGARAIIRKGMNRDIDSYSACFENDRSTQTGLNGYLFDNHFKRVFVVGLARNYCVGFSAIDISAEGFETFVVEDGVRAIPDPSDAEMTRKFKANDIAMITSDDIA